MEWDWYASDLHFRHQRIIEFGRPFANVKEHDDTLIANWNALVKPEDKCLLLGDIAFNTGLQCIEQLNGIKFLVMGNHEHKNIREYIPYFEDIKACEQAKIGDDRIVFTHIPVHHTSLHRWKHNVHGHTHFENIPDNRYFQNIIDNRYTNISMEQIDYKPISREQLIERIKSGRKSY